MVHSVSGWTKRFYGHQKAAIFEKATWMWNEYLIQICCWAVGFRRPGHVGSVNTFRELPHLQQRSASSRLTPSQRRRRPLQCAGLHSDPTSLSVVWSEAGTWGRNKRENNCALSEMWANFCMINVKHTSCSQIPQPAETTRSLLGDMMVGFHNHWWHGHNSTLCVWKED